MSQILILRCGESGTIPGAICHIKFCNAKGGIVWAIIYNSNSWRQTVEEEAILQVPQMADVRSWWQRGFIILKWRFVGPQTAVLYFVESVLCIWNVYNTPNCPVFQKGGGEELPSFLICTFVYMVVPLELFISFTVLFFERKNVWFAWGALSPTYGRKKKRLLLMAKA